MSVDVVSLSEKFTKLKEQNVYRIVAQMNNYQFKLNVINLRAKYSTTS